MPQVARTCERCGTAFTVPASRVRQGRGRFCSRSCRPGEPPAARTCQRCGTAFTVPAWVVRQGNGRFCSRSCTAGEPSVDRTCQRCGTAFTAKASLVKRGNGRFCSRSCSAGEPSVDRTCQRCGGTFTAYAKDVHNGYGNYCSRPCARGEPPVDRTCQRCGAAFSVPASRVRKGHGHFCSIGCSKGDPPVDRACSRCGTAFTTPASVALSGRGVYCSRRCYLTKSTSTLEREVGETLPTLGLTAEAQVRYRGRRSYTLDYVLHGPPPVVLEVHGCYWHGHGCDLDNGRGPAIRRARDRDLRADLAIAGHRHAVVWECEWRAHGVAAVARALEVVGIAAPVGAGDRTAGPRFTLDRRTSALTACRRTGRSARHSASTGGAAC